MLGNTDVGVLETQRKIIAFVINMIEDNRRTAENTEKSGNADALNG